LTSSFNTLKKESGGKREREKEEKREREKREKDK